MKFILNIFCVFFLLVTGLSATNQTTVAVLDFAQMQTGQADMKKHRWLSKALSDLLIGDLGTHGELRLVTRENMRMLMQEADLRELSGLTEDRLDPEEYSKMRQYLKIDRLVFGTFSINADEINIQTKIIDHDTGVILAEFSRTGLVSESLNLEKNLARAMLHYFSNGEIPEDAWVLPKWTDSMEASELLYDGVDAFDAGRYNHAWYCFRRAAQVDPEYADAVYWAGRMHYYRQDYLHAHTAYRDFVRRFPGHSRVGDAVTEYVHSRESGAMAPEAALGLEKPGARGYQKAEPTPFEMLELYRSLRAHEWNDVYVQSKVDYVSRSPLADWLMKREQQALAYMGRYKEAFALLEKGLQMLPDDTEDASAKIWRNESIQLMATLAMESEDIYGQRLESEFLQARDWQLTLDNPVAEENVDLKGGRVRWGTNWRILAPPGYSFKTVRTEIFRTYDPKVSSICRLQIRRYRYVDIAMCSRPDKEYAGTGRHANTVEMPPGITWFYLRPEHSARNAEHSRFDGWRLEADLVPIPTNAGGIRVNVENAHDHNTYINGIYTRCYNGFINNLAPGKYSLRIGPMWTRIPWGFQQQEREVEVLPNEMTDVNLRLAFTNDVHEAGWIEPVAIARSYPTYKHRPRPDSNWLSGPPVICIHPETGRYIAVWSHLDDLWYSTSDDGSEWSEPDTLPAPVNSADAEVNPRMIVDDQGRYCLLFLSNRGMFRNLAVYATWSRNLKRWSRPVMVSPNHHLDHDFIQDNQGRYLLLLVPDDKLPGSEAEQDATISLHASIDLAEWVEPVPDDIWRGIFVPQRLSPERQASFATTRRPGKARIVQDHTGCYHIVWSEKGERSKHMWRAFSHNLKEWSMPDRIPPVLRFSPHNISVTATDTHLVTAMIISDGLYSGHEMFNLSCIPLPHEPGRKIWRQTIIPALAVSGMPDITYDTSREQLVVVWQMAEHQLHPTRTSGPVYLMTGRNLSMQPLKPVVFGGMHAKFGRVLDKLIARLSAGENLTGAEQSETHQLCVNYMNEFNTYMKSKQFRTEDYYKEYAAYYLNNFKMAAILPQWHGGRTARPWFVRDVFFVLQHQIEADDKDICLRASFIMPALFNDRLDEAVLEYEKLEQENRFLADVVVSVARWVSVDKRNRFENDPQKPASAQAFLKAVGMDSVGSRQYQ